MNFAAFDLNLLRVLDALLREKSTTRAGERIGLSQPAVSAALGRLRHALDDPLFVRHGQALEPTDFARGLEHPLSEALQRLEAMLSPPDFDPSRATQIFRVSGSDFFAELLMPQLGERLSRLAPGLRVQLVDLVPDNYVDTLDRYLVDIALLPRMEYPAWAKTRHVFDSPFVAIARKGHARLARHGVAPGNVIPLDLFCDLGHVLMSPEGKLRSMGDIALEAVGRERRVVMTMPFFSGVYRAVSQSDLIALIPVQLARHVCDFVGLDIYRAPVPLPEARLDMVWHRRSDANAAHAWLRDQIADVLSALRDSRI